MSEIKESSIDSIQIGPDDTKATVRGKVWDYLEKHGIALDTKAPRRRISNFKGSEEAGVKISELQVFKDAKVVGVGLDDSLQEIRFRTLEAGKTLLVPTPCPMNHVVSRIIPPEDSSPEHLRSCAARQGIEQHSKEVDIDEKVSVDVYIIGSVAVSPKGARIGKGGGLSDLEYVMLVSLGDVDRNVPVITMVHDRQVMDLPDSMFCSHDLPVDVIVTPTRVIECTGKLQKPLAFIGQMSCPLLRRIYSGRFLEGLEARIGVLMPPPSLPRGPSKGEGKDVADEQEQSGPSVQSCKEDPPPPRPVKSTDPGCKHDKSKGLKKNDLVICNKCGWRPLEDGQEQPECECKWSCTWCTPDFPAYNDLKQHLSMHHECHVCLLCYEIR